ncbi:MAG: nitrogen regulation protein NR(I) [Gammaproteobacteria bacterium]|nr:MAG: nitrogen regulation protein NR(I) [Gammaproteobacteria bacterium]
MTGKQQIWVIDDDSSIRWVLEKALQRAGMEVVSFESGSRALEALAQEEPAVIVSDIRMPGIDGLELLERINGTCPDLPVIIMTAHSDLDSAVSAYKGGAFEYLPKPFDVDEAAALVQRALDAREQQVGQEAAADKPEAPEIIGKAPAMQEVFRAIGRLSHSNATVLINGESGTGKELVALALHRHSSRADKPFVALNMAASPRDLLESELFGHERGAFTGAQQRRTGRFEQANGGTLMLDEIGDMPAELQTRLLRVLADGEFYPVGAHIPKQVDVRIIAATHQDLEQRVRNGEFREDLFHRLNVIRIHIPSLRERREDIPALLQYFLDKAARELDVETKQLSPETEKMLVQMDWPGNVRQLENLCRWLTVMAPGQEVRPGDLPAELVAETAVIPAAGGGWQQLLQQWVQQQLADGHRQILDTAIPVFERTLIEAALQHTGGKRQEAARLLGWGRNTLTRKLKELDLNDH